MSTQDQQPLNQVYWLRGQKVMIDADVAALFQVSLKILRQRVSRNEQRFPPDFLFRPTAAEWRSLQKQVGSPITIGDGEIPMLFTEAGVLMVSGIIKSEVAIKVSIDIINEFFQVVRSFKK
ncbi:ORF6N domain-containing protein [Mucilaginibacter sp. 21P]|uniref:ORF6N domain-containing protein n=1 Tax=Mucilaginibacter sp. 21P TaxID=2778902 RepID=UPI001C58750E|nr:ORF6N domain-containing protein [Mucilaginibacter sp. 21P]QXV64038.1 ORF6N domain-containing protein [Mucilaginibacter sp. 21P]